MASGAPISLLAALTVLALAQPGQPGKILLYPMGQCYNSHVRLMNKIRGLLVTNGHHVATLISANISNMADSGDEEAAAAGGGSPRVVPQVITYNPPKGVKNLCDLDHSKGDISPLNLALTHLRSAEKYCDAMLSDRRLMLQLKSARFDLIVVDAAETCHSLLVDYLDIPQVTLASVYTPQTSSDLLYHVHTPNIFLPFTDRMTLFQRLVNLSANLFIQILRYSIHLPLLRGLREKHGFNSSLPIGEDTADRSAINFVNEDFGIDYPHPLQPNAVPIGLFFIDTLPAGEQRLAAAYQEFLGRSKKQDIILISFGTHVSSLSPALDAAICEMTRTLPYRFIWRRAAGLCPGACKGHYKSYHDALGLDIEANNNTLTSSWLPQAALLAQPTVKLFITHGGASSTKEAAYHGVPVVVIPLQAEQHYQAVKLTQYHGMGLMLPPKDVTKRSLKETIMTVIDNPLYRCNAKHLAAKVRNNPEHARNQMLYWIDYILMHHGGMHLRASGANRLSWYQALMLDVYGIILIVFLFLFFLLYQMQKVTFRFLRSMLRPTLFGAFSSPPRKFAPYKEKSA